MLLLIMWPLTELNEGKRTPVQAPIWEKDFLLLLLLHSRVFFSDITHVYQVNRACFQGELHLEKVSAGPVIVKRLKVEPRSNIIRHIAPILCMNAKVFQSF